MKRKLCGRAEVIVFFLQQGKQLKAKGIYEYMLQWVAQVKSRYIREVKAQEVPR